MRKLAFFFLVLPVLGYFAYVIFAEKEIRIVENKAQAPAWQVLNAMYSPHRSKPKMEQVFQFSIYVPGRFDDFRAQYQQEHPEDLVWSQGDDPESRNHIILTNYPGLDDKYFEWKQVRSNGDTLPFLRS